MMKVFAEAFEDPDSYAAAPPSDTYLEGLLASGDFIALIAEREERVVGALAGYVLRKFERERAEIYIYDLAVAEAWRRRGIATALIGEVRAIAAERGAWAVYVQADLGDDAAIALYSRDGRREDVLHFDFDPLPRGAERRP